MSGYIKGLGIPYMGSKRKLAPKIIDFILKENPKCKYIYDLFGGGGAISFEAIQRNQIKKVHYNDFNTGVVSLLKDIRDNGVTDKYYKWVTRDEFNKFKTSDDWFGGLVKTCWSFGNDQNSYIYSKILEEGKRLVHEIIVNGCDVSRVKLCGMVGKTILYRFDIKKLPNETFKDRRLRILKKLSNVKGLKMSENLTRVQNLERMQNLQNLQNLQITNKSYIDVEIDNPVNETIIYLDPPYKNTKKYELSICHDELLDYIENHKYKIYMSSYDSELPCVLELNHRSSLSATNNSKKVVEKLFISNKYKRKEERKCRHDMRVLKNQ